MCVSVVKSQFCSFIYFPPCFGVFTAGILVRNSGVNTDLFSSGQNRVGVQLSCILVHWKDSDTLNGTDLVMSTPVFTCNCCQYDCCEECLLLLNCEDGPQKLADNWKKDSGNNKWTPVLDQRDDRNSRTMKKWSYNSVTAITHNYSRPLRSSFQICEACRVESEIVLQSAPAAGGDRPEKSFLMFILMWAVSVQLHKNNWWFVWYISVLKDQVLSLFFKSNKHV